MSDTTSTTPDGGAQLRSAIMSGLTDKGPELCRHLDVIEP